MAREPAEQTAIGGYSMGFLKRLRTVDREPPRSSDDVTETNAPSSLRSCVYCHESFPHFLPYTGGGTSPVMEKLQAVGSDVENFSCPACGSHDRERHLLMYFDKLDLWEVAKAGTVVHFAPEPHFGSLLQSRALEYLACDKWPTNDSWLAVDISAMPFETDSVHMLIANHVLEHVDDDQLAMREIHRVLKPGGAAVLQTPFTWMLEQSLENPSITDEDLRLFFFGQEDHVRFFGRDLFSRLADAGLDVQIHEHDALLTGIDPVTTGVNVREPLILVWKPV